MAMLMAALLGGAVTAFFFSRYLSASRVRLRPHPFGIESGEVVIKGGAFNSPSAIASTRSILELCGFKPGSEILTVTPEILSRLESDLAKNPKDPLLLYLRGRLLETLGRGAEAESSFQKSVQRSPQFAFPHIRLGRLHAHAGFWPQAERDYRMAFSLLASDPVAYKQMQSELPALEMPPHAELGALYLARGHIDSLALLLEAAASGSIRDPNLEFLRARLWEEQGRLAQADSVYRLLAESHPDRAEFADARITLGLKSPRGPLMPAARASAVFALSLLEPLTKRFPRNAPLWMALGQAYLHRGLNTAAASALDSAIRLDPGLSEARSLRDAAYHAWKGEELAAAETSGVRPMDMAAAIANDSKRPIPDSTGGAVQVIIPGKTGLLGAYTVPWGATVLEVRKSYPTKRFETLPGGNLRESLFYNGLRYNQILAFKSGELWGVFVVVDDSTKVSGDVLGDVLRLKSGISGEGRGTGMTACPGWRKFQGVIWENEDTFEFLAHFEDKINQVRLARVRIESLPAERRVCDLARYLDPKVWK